MNSPPPERLRAALADRYRLERELGQGGMATVYLAHDLKHDRDVAIKVLHPDLGAALGGDRFLAEIRTTAKLQHPHILPLLDSGAADGLFFYVMPLVTGETLRARLEREQQLPIADAVRLAREVASALDYAHRQGVIHRDIKPENILLHDGQAIVADFGIALAVQSAGGARMTQTGLSLGTPQYMSPEQAMGERGVDARSDIYALGAVTYEMLAGEPPFTGPNVQAIVAKVMSERPVPLHTVRDTVPAPLEQAVLAALAKLPADRPATAAAFVAMLAESATSTGPVAARGATSEAARRRWIGVAAGALVGAVAATAALGVAALRRPSSPPAVVRFSMAGRTGTLFATFSLALSADGRAIAFADPAHPARPGIRVRRVDREAIDVLPGTERAADVAFSPDGRSLVYATRDQVNELHTVGIDGKSATRLTAAAGASSVVWTNDGYVYWLGLRTISRMPAAGGTPEVLFEQDSTDVKTTAEGALLSLVVLDGGRHFLSAARGSGLADGKLLLIDAAAKTQTVLGRGIAALGVRDGWLLYGMFDGTVKAQRLDLAKRTLVGPAIPVLAGVLVSDFVPAVSLGADGSLVYVPEENAASKLVWVTRTGLESEVDTALTRAFASPALAPAGDRIAVSIREGGNSGAIWLYDLQRRTLARMTPPSEQAIRPNWTPDGARVLFVGDHGMPGQRRIFSLAPDGGDPARLVVSRTRLVQEVSWPAAGPWIAFREGYSDGGMMRDIYAVVPGDTAVRAVVATTADEASPAVSPDGRWLAYTSNASGRVEAYVTPFPAGGARIQLSTNGASSPVWSRDGRELFYRDGSRTLIATAMNTAAANPIGASRPLFSTAGFLEDNTTARSFDVTRDGRFLFVRPQRGSISVALGWWTEAAATLAAAKRP
jgi:serine/threonine-protein kinase